MEERVRLVLKLVLLIIGTIVLVLIIEGVVLEFSARLGWGLWGTVVLGVLVVAGFLAYIIADYVHALHKRRRQVGE